MNLYEILEVDREASVDEIKQSYRKLAMKWHPDKHPPEKQKEATETFKKINKAFETLSNPHEREKYNNSNPVKRETVKKPDPPKSDYSLFEKSSYLDGGVIISESEADSVPGIFIAGNSTGRSIMVHLKLTPSERKYGCVKDVIYKKKSICKLCTGDGKFQRECPACKGDNDFVGWCSRCQGYATVDVDCLKCKGTGLVGWVKALTSVRISPNIQVGHTVNVMGVGEPSPGKPPGNLRVVIV